VKPYNIGRILAKDASWGCSDPGSC